METVWHFLAKNLKQDGRAVLITVVESIGSAPGRLGFKMALSATGGQFGTIGGGIMEFNLAQQWRASKLDEPNQLLQRIHQARAPEQERSGLICAGSQRLAVANLGPEDLDAVSALANAERTRKAQCFQLSQAGLSLIAKQTGPPELALTSATEWRYRETAGRPDMVYIIGGGHVGLAVSRALAPLDMRVVVCDHRTDVATITENRWADEILITPYEKLDELVEEGDHVYVVIVTTAMPFDAESLYRVIGKDLRYIGLMGAHAKLTRIFETLKKRGINPALFDKVRAPIGLLTHNHTPAEIGISVAAQIIQVRNA